MNEKMRMKLLGELIDALQEGKRRTPDLNSLYAFFYTKGGKKFCGLSASQALDCLFNDVYLFEDFDLRMAESLTLEIM